MKRFSLIRLEWNNWNGFMFELMAIEANGFEGSLLGLHITNREFIFEIGFIQFTVASPFV